MQGLRLTGLLDLPHHFAVNRPWCLQPPPQGFCPDRPMTRTNRRLRSNFPRGSYLWAARNAQWHGMGLSEEDCEKPKIAIVNSSSGLAACYAHLDGIVPALKEAMRAAGAVPLEVRTAAPSDYITGAGGRGGYLLSARDLVTNDVEVA